MATGLEPNLDLDAERLLTAADIVKRFGAIPSWRIISTPPLGF